MQIEDDVEEQKEDPLDEVPHFSKLERELLGKLGIPLKHWIERMRFFWIEKGLISFMI